MAIKSVCAVHDRVASTYGTPIFTPTKGVAIRMFTDEVNRIDSNTDLNAHPEDFDLFELGTFCDGNGSFQPHDIPVLLLLGKEAVQG